MSKKGATQERQPDPMQMPAVDPAMLEGLQQITPYNVSLFFLSNPNLMTPGDDAIIKKCGKNVVSYGIFGTIAGITVNVLAKRLYSGILTLPLYARLPLRLGLFALPFALLSNRIITEGDKLARLNHKYFVRIVKFRQSGNYRDLVPDGPLPGMMRK